MPTPNPPNGDRRPLRTRCVLWHAPGAEVPANLGASLTARPVDVEPCDNPYAALAALCDGGRDPAPRPTLLVLIEPATLPLAPRVLVLAEQFVPHAARWAYEAGAEVKLRTVTATMVANLHRAAPVPLMRVISTRHAPAHASTVATIPPSSPTSQNPPHLPARGANNGKHGEMGKSTPAAKDPVAQKTPVSIVNEAVSLSLGLTAEELAMLLADGPENSGGSAGSAGAATATSERTAPPTPPAPPVPPSPPGAQR